MAHAHQITTLHELLSRIASAAHDRERISLGSILKLAGRRSFGPLLVVAGLVAIFGDIPSVPTLTGVFVMLIAGQLVLHRDHFWLPHWLLRRSVSRDRLRKALKLLRRPARFVDRHLHPRLSALTRTVGTRVMAAVCLLIALTMPAMEILPILGNIAGAAFIAFGLSLIAHDGLLALAGFAFTALIVVVAASFVL